MIIKYWEARQLALGAVYKGEEMNPYEVAQYIGKKVKVTGIDPVDKEEEVSEGAIGSIYFGDPSFFIGMFDKRGEPFSIEINNITEIEEIE